MPLSVVVSNIVKFAVQLGLLIVTMTIFAVKGTYQFNFGMHILLLPAVLVVMACLGLGSGIIISSLTTKYRDFTVLISFGVQLLMYITPIAYPLSYFKNSGHSFLRMLITYNPLSPLVETYRYAVLGVGSFSPVLFLYSCVVTLLILLVGMIIFSKVERTFMDTV